MKRIFDFLISLIGLTLCSPFLIPVIIVVWMQDWHSPFYIAERVGQGDKPFKMVKLRSMIINAHKSGVDSTSSNDKRITGVGRIIRRYKLDELSQLWNVLIGDMSLVGPRPTSYSSENYKLWQTERFDVVPGMTGLWQILGRGAVDIDTKTRLDIAYIERASLWLDINILFRTIPVVLMRREVH
jgi:lipopolysaccharide/colanic/teichoic acid biosynthesis glycosyltransferase